MLKSHNQLAGARAGFLNLPASVRMSPEGGLMHLLPRETRSLTVWYCPAGAGPQGPFSLLCQGSLGASQKLRCSATGIRSPLVLSSNEIKVHPLMPSTQL